MRVMLVMMCVGVDSRYANDGFYENELIKDCECVVRFFVCVDVLMVVCVRMCVEDIV